MISNNPKVSIIIPVYNGAEYVSQAIESAINQTYSNIEIIVVNDGSTDNTEEVIQPYMNKIVYIIKENGGVSTALNLAIEKMTGDYFSWLSHDDLYLFDKIEKQIEYLSKLDDDKVIVFSNYALIDWKGNEYRKPIIHNHDMLVEKPEYSLLRGCIGGITLLIPKVAFDICGNFDTSLRCTQDYELWGRMLKESFKFLHMADVLTKTRIHRNQTSYTNPNVLSEGNSLWIFLVELLPNNRKIELEGDLFDFYYEFALYLQSTEYKEAVKFCISKCIEIDSVRYSKRSILLVKNSFLRRVIKRIKNDGIVFTIREYISNRVRI